MIYVYLEFETLDLPEWFLKKMRLILQEHIHMGHEIVVYARNIKRGVDQFRDWFDLDGTISVLGVDDGATPYNTYEHPECFMYTHLDLSRNSIIKCKLRRVTEDDVIETQHE